MKENITSTRIREMRNERHMTAEQLGEDIGKDKVTVYRYETGKIVKIPYVTLAKLAKSLNTSVDYLTGNTDNKKRRWSDVVASSDTYEKIHVSANNLIGIDKRLEFDNLFQLSEKEIEFVSAFTENAGVLDDSEIDVLSNVFSSFVEKHKKDYEK